MPGNVITAKFCSGTKATTAPLYQWDYGQELHISGLDLPQAFTVHFSNQPIIGTAKSQIGTESAVVIPDEYLTTGLPVYAWIFLHAGEEDGETEYAITIPVIKRPKPVDEVPTPVQQSEINAAIAALNAGVTRAEEYADTATEQAGIAQNAANTASQAADKAEQSAGQSGYMYFYIDENGHLIYTHTSNVDVDFILENGHLYVESVA